MNELDLNIKAQDSLSNSSVSSKGNSRWVLSLYGTAIGAGTLFLPINAGLHGIWPMLFMLILAFPLTYYSHLGLSRFVLSAKGQAKDITEVAVEHFGPRAGTVLNLLYFLAIFPTMLLYSTAITNTTEHFLRHQLAINPPPRALLALLLLFALMRIVHYGQEQILRIMSYLVYPFIASLLFFALYLIPYWNGALFQAIPLSSHSPSFMKTLWLMIPVLLFSFNHLAIISAFAMDSKKRFGLKAESMVAKILKQAHLLMLFTVMLFVFSCALSLSPQDLAMAKAQNISILSYLANYLDSPFIGYFAPMIAFIAIAKSFLGHYLGAAEGLEAMLKNLWPTIQPKQTRWLSFGFMLLSCWLTASLNPNILTMIESLGGPIIAIILCLLPVFAVYRVPCLQQYKSLGPNLFILGIGFTSISAILYGIWNSL